MATIPLYASYVFVMIGSESIDINLENIWRSWLFYRKGKKLSRELLEFQYNLEENLQSLYADLQNGTYKHGSYKTFIVADNKKREISVGSIRDRIVHRMVYDYLNELYDRTFSYDVWSCRLKKGLLGAIERVQQFLHSHPQSYIWRADIQKFFDSVNHDILLKMLSQHIKEPRTISLIEKIIRSFSKQERTGMPIGNLTSQIFANIYLNELDQFILHSLKPQGYVRHGDDFILVHKDREQFEHWRKQVCHFLQENLRLQLHRRNNLIVRSKHGLKFLGVVLFPHGRKLNKRNIGRLHSRLNQQNAGSYFGLVQKHGNMKSIKQFQWLLLEQIP